MGMEAMRHIGAIFSPSGSLKHTGRHSDRPGTVEHDTILPCYCEIIYFAGIKFNGLMMLDIMVKT